MTDFEVIGYLKHNKLKKILFKIHARGTKCTPEVNKNLEVFFDRVKRLNKFFFFTYFKVHYKFLEIEVF